MASPSCLASRGFLRPNSWTAASSSERVRPQLSKSSARHWEKEMKTSLISHPELYFNLAFQTKSINISLTVRPGELTHLDLLFGVINIWRFFLEFSRDCFEFLRDVMESWAEVLFNFSGFLNFSLFRKNLENARCGNDIKCHMTTFCTVFPCGILTYFRWYVPDPRWHPTQVRPRPAAWRFQRAVWCRGPGTCSVAALLIYPHSDDTWSLLHVQPKQNKWMTLFSEIIIFWGLPVNSERYFSRF